MRKTALDMVYEFAKQDERVVFIGSDLSPGTLSRFREEMPERFFMEGVCEARSEEHTSELKSRQSRSYAVFCLKKKKIKH